MTPLDLVLAHPFLQRAIVAALLVALLCAVLGVFIVLRGLSMLGDGLAHISLAGYALGLVVAIYPGAMQLAAALMGGLAIHWLREKGIVKGDAAIGILFTFGLAMGVILMSTSRGFNVDIQGVLFGNLVAIRGPDVWLVAGLGGGLLVLLGLFYKEFFYLTFSEESARTSGLPVGWLSVLFTIFTAAAVVAASRIVGVLLVSSLLIIPASSAFQFARSFRGALALAVGFGLTSVLAGMWLAIEYPVPPGATIAVTAFLLFGASLVVKRVRGAGA